MCTTEFDGDVAVDGAVSPVPIESLACRAYTVAIVMGQCEVGVAVEFGLGCCLGAFVPERIGLAAVDILISIALITLAIAVVGDVGVYPVFAKFLEVGFGVVACICAERGCLGGIGLDGFDDRDQELLFRTSAMGLSIDDDL